MNQFVNTTTILTTLLILSLVALPQLSQAKDKTDKQTDFQVFQKDLDKLLSNKILADELERELNNSEKTAAAVIETENMPETQFSSANTKRTSAKTTKTEIKTRTINNAHARVKNDKTRQSSDYETNFASNFQKQSTLKAISEIESTIKRVSPEKTSLDDSNTTRFADKKLASDLETNKKTSYWKTVHALESSEGKRMYRPSNKSRSCKWTSTPCGHHQLSAIALKDIGCTSLKCRSARSDFKKSLAMSKKLEEINAKRLKKFGFDNLPDYQKYLAHQQGSAGIKIILKALQGKKRLSKNMLKMMANNSPYSYKHLRRQGSRAAARKFLRFWKEKWKVKSSRRIASR